MPLRPRTYPKKRHSRTGYEIHAAHGPQAALAALARTPFDLVISDQSMPEMTGVEFLSIVRRLYPGAVRIVATVHDDGGTIADAVNRAGIHKYLQKDRGADFLRTEVRDAFLRYGSAL